VVYRRPVEPHADAGAPAPAADEPRPVRSPIVVFEGVSFRYLAERPQVLDDVSFEIPATGLTAIVGPSGAGKTTLFALLERFYDPGGGRIEFDGRPLGEWPRAALRARIGYVEQDAPVLAGSLRENLRYAAPDAGDEELSRVLHDARLETLVERLPDGLDTGVGARGTTLSGGERQRIAIARALLRRPRLLLLDEASSQLDAVNELALRDVVARAARSCAVVAIAHRLSTVTSAARIVVLEAGRVRAIGTHDELVARDSLYAELAATQLAPPAAQTA
jgi:ABC-type multidrug transport system fused ATPase/permease subunit